MHTGSRVDVAGSGGEDVGSGGEVVGAGGEVVGAGVPDPRRPAESPTSADVLRGLGLEALVQILERSAYGVCVTGDDHTWLYLNPAGARLVGRPFEELQGRDYLESFPEHERAVLLGLEQDQRDGDTGFYSNTIVQPDGTEIPMTWSGTAVEVDGHELAPAIFHATADLRRAEREAAGLGAAAAQVAGGTSVGDVLGALAREAVDRTRAVGCVVLLPRGSGPLTLAASADVPVDAASTVTDAGMGLTDLPGADLLLAGRLVPYADDRRRMAQSPVTAGLAATAATGSWEGSVKAPLHRGGEVVGCLIALLPAEVTGPSETELAFWSALAAHASISLENARLREQVASTAAELERRRLGRDLHDSVSQALFALHARAEVVTRALAADNTPLLQAAAEDMEAISRQAIAEMRATLAELRSERTPLGLLAGLEELARRTTEREGLPTELRVEGQLPVVSVEAAEHVHRIAGEALHNSVKHAMARSAVLAVEVQDGGLVLRITDDGRGFDPGTRGGTGHGRRTMQERAALCQGSVEVESAPGAGTTVVVRVPI